jgi:hypothetical protein
MENRVTQRSSNLEHWVRQDSEGKNPEVSKVTPNRGEDNPRSGDGNPESSNCNSDLGSCHPESGNRNPDSGNSNLGKDNDWQGEEPVSMVVKLIRQTRFYHILHQAVPI